MEKEYDVLRKRLQRRTVSENFRHICAEALPGLGDNLIYWRLLQYFLYGTWFDGESGRLVLSQEVLALIAMQENDGRFTGERLLQRFSQDVAPVRYTEYNRGLHKARELIYADLPPAIVEGQLKDRNMLAHQIGMVYFDTGKKVNARAVKEQRETTKREALEEMALAGCDEARELLRYMNHLAPRKFHKLTTNVKRAQEALQRRSFSEDRERDTRARNRALDVLRAVETQPQPFYRPARRTVRIFSSNDSVLRLPREARAELTKDFTQLDLRSAQLAIVARLWNIPALQTFLETGQSFWDYLWCQCGCPAEYQAFKDVVKTALYSIVFGMTRKKLLHGNIDSAQGVVYDGLIHLLQPFDVTAQQFIAIPLIEALFNARTRIYTEIKQAGGAHDVYGRWIPVTKEISYRSVAAQICQAMELYLMFPVIQVASITDELTVVLWLHDGAYIDVADKRRKELWLNRIRSAVKERACEQQIWTEIEGKDLP